jgi:hypothetical protein
MALLAIGLANAWGADPAIPTNAAAGSASAPATETTLANPPAAAPIALPGKGLAQHDFLYTGEYDTRNKDQTLSLVRNGKLVWTYTIPTKDPNNNLSEYSDIHMLSNGDIVFAYKTGWRKINQAKETIFDFQCPKDVAPNGADYWRECHSAQPIGPEKVLFMLNGTPAKLCLYNIKTGKMEMEHVMQTKKPDDPKSVHGQFRHVRMTRAGTYLIAHMDLGKVIEYDKDWKEICSCDAPSVWAAIRLKNGNTLISGNQHAWAREVNPKGEIVWQVNKDDLPGIPLHSVQELNRLENGNTVICNWTAGVKIPDWPTIVQVIEVTPDKKAVWAVREWTDPDLGPSSCIQLLDEPGVEENGDLQR